jgi:hypothetical protein
VSDACRDADCQTLRAAQRTDRRGIAFQLLLHPGSTKAGGYTVHGHGKPMSYIIHLGVARPALALNAFGSGAEANADGDWALRHHGHCRLDAPCQILFFILCTNGLHAPCIMLHFHQSNTKNLTFSTGPCTNYWSNETPT